MNTPAQTQGGAPETQTGVPLHPRRAPARSRGGEGMSAKCAMCLERKKDWNRSDPVCFLEDGPNWNCATLNAIRDICYEGQNPMPIGVDYQYCEDQKYATIKIQDVELNNGNYIGLALWVSWYKSRGKTDCVWVLNDDSPPRKPTEEELLAIINYYNPPTQ